MRLRAGRAYAHARRSPRPWRSRSTAHAIPGGDRLSLSPLPSGERGGGGGRAPASLLPPQRVGSCPRRTRPTRGAGAPARHPQKGRQRYKTGLLCNRAAACTKGPARFVSLRLRAGRARPARQGGARRHRGTRAQRSTRGPPRKERRREGAERARCDGEQPSSSSPPGWRLHPPGPSGSPDAARAAAAAGAAEHSGGRRRKGGTGGGWCCRGATKWGLRVLWRQRSADRSGETPAHR